MGLYSVLCVVNLHMGVHVYVFIFCDKQLKSVKDTNSQELSFSKTLLPMCIELHVYHVF